MGAALGLGLRRAVRPRRAPRARTSPTALPVLALVAFALVAVLAGIAAAVLPARRASRLNVLKRAATNSRVPESEPLASGEPHRASRLRPGGSRDDEIPPPCHCTAALPRSRAATAGAAVSPPQPTGAAPVGFTRTTLTDHHRGRAAGRRHRRAPRPDPRLVSRRRPRLRAGAGADRGRAGRLGVTARPAVRGARRSRRCGHRRRAGRPRVAPGAADVARGEGAHGADECPGR